jgi:hypothetical protein
MTARMLSGIPDRVVRAMLLIVLLLSGSEQASASPASYRVYSKCVSEDNGRDFAKLDNVQASRSALVLRNERLRPFEAASELRLRELRALTRLDKQFTELRIRFVRHGM